MARRLCTENDGPLAVMVHSLGGRVVMEIARQAHGRVRALVLANTGHNAQASAELPERQAKIDLAHTSMAKLAVEGLPAMLDPARLGEFICRVLLITGAQGAWSPEQQHSAITVLLTDVEVQVIKNAGHLFTVERPEKMAPSPLNG
jgi:pimeloyl-ACP methyl ester carboxylesterase